MGSHILGLIGMFLFLNCITKCSQNPLGAVISATSGDNGKTTVNAEGLTVVYNQPNEQSIDNSQYIQSNVKSPNGEVGKNSLGQIQ